MRAPPFLPGFAAAFLLAASTGAAAPIAASAPGTVELHAHLFMNEGMTWGFRGDFDDGLKARSWKDKLSNQADFRSLEASGNSIVVVSLYAHPLFTLSLRSSIRRQIARAEELAAEHPGWVLAKSPAEARDAIRSGRKVLVLSLEGAAGILETERDIQEFVDQKGIRIVTLLHLTDDEIGGPALLRGIAAFSSPFAWIRQALKPHHGDEGVRANDRGLTEHGARLARALAARGVWIDLAHSSDRAQSELLPILRETGQPLLYTHTILRRYHGAERGISRAQLERVADSGGIVGIMPSEEMLAGTPTPDGTADPGCRAGLGALIVQYREMAAILGPQAVALGSDTNGGITHLPPGCPATGSLAREGLWNIGQTAELWRALRESGSRDAAPRAHGSEVERFLAAWERAHGAARLSTGP